MGADDTADETDGEGDEAAEEPEDRAVSRQPRFTITGRRDLEMDTIGWLIFLILIVILLPLLPFLLLLAALTRLLGFGRPRAVSWG